MVRFQAAKVWGIWGMSQEPAAFLLDLSSQLLRPTGWSLGFGPRSLFLRLVCPCHECVARCRAVSWSTELEHCLVRKAGELLGWGTELVGLEHRAG